MATVTHPFQQLALNNAYANRTLFASLAGVDKDTFTAGRPGFFSSISRTLNHIHEVDLFYLDALENGGKGRTVFNRSDIDEVASLATAQAETDLRLAVYCSNIADVSRPVSVERRDDETKETIGAILLHLFQHQIHHRGQAHVQLGDAGIAPPQLDEFFLEFERAPIAMEYYP